MLFNLLMILLTLLILSILVVVHEFGHYIAAKKMGVFVEEFSIGMGPSLFSRQGRETLFSIRALPLGGFCKMRGEGAQEDDDDAPKADQPESLVKDDTENTADAEDPRSFANKTKGQRFVILVAGAAMNILFAYVLLIVIFILRGANPLQALGSAAVTTVNFAGTIYQSLYMLITGQVGMNEMAGPIGMVSMVHDFFQYGAVTLMTFTALISVNLGVINLLPLPALDGGQIFIIIIEKLVRRDLDPKKANMINYVGFMALMLLAVVIAVNDVLRIIG
ncbi:MAG: site-2 protease family protein [Eubacterium sp.]|nr:site-2 protease family protein [Eubacterium sp.]